MRKILVAHWAPTGHDKETDKDATFAFFDNEGAFIIKSTRYEAEAAARLEDQKLNNGATL
jgi:hypothetical protein